MRLRVRDLTESEGVRGKDLTREKGVRLESLLVIYTHIYKESESESE